MTQTPTEITFPLTPLFEQQYDTSIPDDISYLPPLYKTHSTGRTATSLVYATLLHHRQVSKHRQSDNIRRFHKINTRIDQLHLLTESIVAQQALLVRNQQVIRQQLKHIYAALTYTSQLQATHQTNHAVHTTTHPPSQWRTNQSSDEQYPVEQALPASSHHALQPPQTYFAALQPHMAQPHQHTPTGYSAPYCYGHSQ
jgi:hypothetical protein